MDRPLGITILGGLVGLAALISFLISLASFIVGLAFLLPFPAQGGPLLLNGLLFFGIAIVLGAASFGLIQMRAWGWGLAILASLVTLVYVGYNAFLRPDASLSLTSAVTLVIGVAVLIYLLSVSLASRRSRASMRSPSECHDLVDRGEHSIPVGHVDVLERVGERRIEARHPDDGTAEVFGRLLREDRADLAAEAAGR